MSVNCPKCNGNGYVVDKRKQDVKMECLECHTKWVTESKNCPKCHRHNGFVIEGLCCQCYSVQLENNLRK